MSGPADRIHWNGRKWPDQRHWQFDMQRIGEDGHGTWLYAPAGSPLKRGDEPKRRTANGFVALIPREAWWEVEFYWDHPWHSVYVNIGTPCEWTAGGVRQVDLDLDVIRTLDGAVETLDEDEFADHQVRYGYPPELINAARQAADEAALLLQRRVEPFGDAADRWIELFRGDE